MIYNENLKAWIPEGDTHFEKIYQENKEFYQIRMITRLLRFVDRFDLAIDVGAHVGFMTRIFETMFTQVVAFEPSIENYTCLRANLTPKYKTICYNNALGKKEETKTLYIGIRNSGAASLENFEYSKSTQEVQVITLDSIKFDSLNFIKIDAQGAELDIIKGANKTIRKHRPVILVEALSDERPALNRLMKKFEYENVYNVKKDTLWKSL